MVTNAATQVRGQYVRADPALVIASELLDLRVGWDVVRTGTGSGLDLD